MFYNNERPSIVNLYVGLGYVLLWMMASFVFGMKKQSKFFYVTCTIWLFIILALTAAMHFQGFEWVIFPVVMLMTPLHGLKYLYSMYAFEHLDQAILLISFLVVPSFLSFLFGKILAWVYDLKKL
jgi:hypothetical protein